jgi:hypothetical protein
MQSRFDNGELIIVHSSTGSKQAHCFCLVVVALCRAWGLGHSAFLGVYTDFLHSFCTRSPKMRGVPDRLICFCCCCLESSHSHQRSSLRVACVHFYGACNNQTTSASTLRSGFEWRGCRPLLSNIQNCINISVVETLRHFLRTLLKMPFSPTASTRQRQKGSYIID